VSIAVKLYSATEEKNIRFNQVHRDDGGRIKYQRVCAIDGEEVAYDDIAKGYDLGGGQMVILTDDDFADLPLSTSRAIDVLEFVPAEQVDPILFAKAYYLEPEGTATKPYVLLRDALVESERVAIVKVALRQREQLATLRVRDGVMVLNTMLWPDEIRAAEFSFLDENVSVRPAELSMASSLIDSMTGDFDPEDFTDDYREALQRVIDAKVSGQEITEPEPEHVRPTAAIDLMAALKASVDRAKEARGERGPVKSSEPTPITAAKSAKKAAARAGGASGTATKSTGAKAAGATAAATRAAPAKKTAAKKATPAKKTAAASRTTGAAKKTATAKKAPARKAG
jgi:DNA end-binding protein Ku